MPSTGLETPVLVAGNEELADVLAEDALLDEDALLAEDACPLEHAASMQHARAATTVRTIKPLL